MEKLKRYVLPGLIFQSVTVGGGYGTGRELVSFFLVQGPLGGLLAMLLSTAIWSIVCATSYEFARCSGSFDYRSFFSRLLGRRLWFLYEACYLALLMIVLAVIASAAGNILEETFSLPYAAGVIGMMTAIGLLVFGGSERIERFLTGWSLVLYTVYGVLFLWCFSRFGEAILSAFADTPVSNNWPLGGFEYAAYNLATVPALLFCIRHHRNRRETIGAGLLAGPIAIFPGLLFFLAMAGQYPGILDRPVPANMLLEILGSRAFQIVFQVVLFGTLIETGAGMVHAVNERVASVLAESRRPMPPFLRPALAVVLLILGSLMARIGIIDLIEKGYLFMTWGFWAVFVIPILTIGIWKLCRTQPKAGEADPTGPETSKVSRQD